MSTPPIHIKLSRPPSGLTRKVAFDARPAWEELAARIERFYEIPKEHVAVSYVDNEGDEVTMNTETELQDLYSAQPNVSDTIRFVVRDLHNPRDSSAGPAAPSGSTSASGPARDAGAAGYIGPAVQFADNMANVIASFAEMGGANREVVDGIRTAVRRGAPLWQQAVPGFQFGPYPPPPGTPPPPGGRRRHRGPPHRYGSTPPPPRHGSSPPPRPRSPDPSPRSPDRRPPTSDRRMHSPPRRQCSDYDSREQDYHRERHDHRHHHGPPPPHPAFPGAWPQPGPPPPPPVNVNEFVRDTGDDVPPIPGAIPPPPHVVNDTRPRPRLPHEELNLLTSIFAGGVRNPGSGPYGTHNGGPWGLNGAAWGPNVSPGTWVPDGMWGQFDTSARRRSPGKGKESSSESEADEKK